MVEYDTTMYVLTMVLVSLNRIILSGDRVTLEHEYADVIDNLDIYRINIDPDFRCLIEEISQAISKRRLDDEIRQIIAHAETEQVCKSLWRKSIDKFFKSFLDNPKGWWDQPGFSLFNFGASVYQEYSVQQNDSSLRLNEAELRQYGELRNKLLKGLQKLPCREGFSLGRITQRVITVFTKAINFKKPLTRQIKLEAIKNEFSDYAPYWFYRAQASLEAEDNEMAEKYFAKFMNVWREVLFQDPFMAVAMKYKAARLMREGINQANALEIQKCLEEMIANAPQIIDDWANNIFIGMVYFSLGNRKKAEWYVEFNIENELECEKSSELLEYIRTVELPNKVETLPDETGAISLRESEPTQNVQEISLLLSDDDFVELCKSGDVAKVEEAINNGSNVNAVSAKDNDGEAALIWVAKKGHAEVAEVLLKYGADVNIKSNHGTTALMWTARRGYEEVAEVLLKYGADVNVKNNYASTALIWAAKYGNTEVAEILLEHGADINAKANNGWTALIRATMENHDDILKNLLRYGADINAKDNEGWTALRWAERGSYPELAKLLRSYGAK